ncbi:DUF4837 family protein [Flavobacterium sp. MAH-1]|uniref:DUF4837 family protein n=1 Tax=Flavobacterium agri TaxID=2743471 RepID=A0A7Y9C588_9FLAO|nr:DUF4837 family protein [Flavobacterium agri]NUY80089.1 DUF4837 family protein [Flavobacterium agri]NYA70114.1 DUF4837 family protein [Flavobacterium agri]
MKKALFLLPILTLVLICCEKKEPFADAQQNYNQVSLIIDDLLWNGEIGDSLRNKFATPVLGLPQEEPLFTINQYPVKLLEGYMTNSRNIIVVKKTATTSFEIRQNQYMTPQNVVYINGKNTADIIALIEEHAPEIISRIRSTEIQQAQLHLRKSLESDKAVEKKFKVAIDIPPDYRMVMQRKRFLWFKKEIVSGSTSIIIYQIPEKIMGTPGVGKIVKMRDSIGKKYIHGTKPQADMMTENSYTPYFSSIAIDGHRAFETRGTWQLNNDFMSGPFLNYCIYDSKRRVYIIAEGFCYAPSREKRELMFELEAILKTLRFPSKK